MERKLWYLRRLNLFVGLSATEIDLIGQQLHERTCVRGETIIAPYLSSDRIYLVKAGTVRIYRLSREGRELTMAILRPGQLFGTSALAGVGEQATFAEALEDGYICEAKADEFLRTVSSYPLLAAKLLILLAGQVLRLEQQVEQLAFQEVRARLAQVLLQLAEDNGGHLPPRLTHEELAKLVGTTRETITKTLGQFVEQGAVEVGYRRIAIVNAEVLRRSSGLDGIT